ncbi:MAG: hypothetical protein D6743_07165 [Calditrichaeota bacterium]|nr:MAG: hypothetical protein D6743_07165 [Calditrichota bacterium]
MYRIGVDVGGVEVKFCSVEDLIIHKIIAGRARDIEDVRSVIARNPDYDKNYIRSWLKEFDSSLGQTFTKIFDEITSSAQ